MSVIRQGDVLLVQMNAIPKEAAVVKANEKKLIIALGEATGHHHRFEDTSHNVKMFQTGAGVRYLDVSAPADLLHEEHSTAKVPAGFWLIPVQVEYTPKEVRRVAD